MSRKKKLAISVTCSNLRPKSQTATAHHVYFKVTDESPARFQVRMTNVYCRQKRLLFWPRLFLLSLFRFVHHECLFFVLFHSTFRILKIPHLYLRELIQQFRKYLYD